MRQAVKDALVGGAAGPEPDRDSGRPPHALVELELAGPPAGVTATAHGRGAARLQSAVPLEVLRAQLEDSWRRLKSCRNPAGSVAFYDRTKNNNGVWHDVHACGNAANLRASRARKRAADPPTT